MIRPSITLRSVLAGHTAPRRDCQLAARPPVRWSGRDVLTLPIQRGPFRDILSGTKKREFREIKPYYDRMFRDPARWRLLRIRNGYNAGVPEALVEIRGIRKSIWLGHYIVHLGRVLATKFM